MRDAARRHLERCAAEGHLTTYGELWDAISADLGRDLGNHWRQLPNLLGYVSVAAYEDLELIPTALVVAPDLGDEPGPGFFRIAAELGAIPDAEAPPEGEAWTMSPSQRAFWETQVEGLYQRFRRDG